MYEKDGCLIHNMYEKDGRFIHYVYEKDGCFIHNLSEKCDFDIFEGKPHVRREL